MGIEHDSSAARDEILGRIRGALGERRASTPPAVHERPAATTTRPERVARFRAELEAVGGHVHLAADTAAASALLAGLAERLGIAELGLSDDPLVRAVAAPLERVTGFDGWTHRPRLFASDAGLSTAQHGIAETGTLALRSSAERHRLVSLVPPIHIALLPVERLVDGLDEVLAACGTPSGQPDRCVSFITGPSRTGDIEMQLVIGVHGPRELHVLLIDRVHP